MIIDSAECVQNERREHPVVGWSKPNYLSQLFSVQIAFGTGTGTPTRPSHWQTNNAVRWRWWWLSKVWCRCRCRSRVTRWTSAHHYSNNLFVNRKLSSTDATAPIKCHRSPASNWLETISPFSSSFFLFRYSYCRKCRSPEIIIIVSIPVLKPGLLMWAKQIFKSKILKMQLLDLERLKCMRQRFHINLNHALMFSLIHMTIIDAAKNIHMRDCCHHLF